MTRTYKITIPDSFEARHTARAGHINRFGRPGCLRALWRQAWEDAAPISELPACMALLIVMAGVMFAAAGMMP